MGRLRSGRFPFLVFCFRAWTNDSRRRLRRVEKWETGLWFSTFPSGVSLGCGNVGISRGWRDFQGAVERVGNVVLVFHSFHGPGISTALLLLLQKRGGSGDSILQWRKSLALAALIFLAHSVSLRTTASRSSRAKLRFGLRYFAASGRDFSFSYGVA